jgi:hypothetical protein
MKNKVIKNIVKKILHLYYEIPEAMVHRENKKYILHNASNYAATSLSSYYNQYVVRPKYKDDYPVLPDDGNSDSAIIMQGPLRLKEHFTYETILFYQKMFPDTEIIVSTWENENEEEINRIRNIGAMVVQSKVPEYAGIGNVNLQLVSSRAGIRTAKSQGKKYVLKTRTDQRIYRRGVISYMKNLVKLFPADMENPSVKGRIIVLNGGYGNMFLPFYHADVLYFGFTEDIETLFGDEKFMRNLSIEESEKIIKEDRNLSRYKFLCYRSSQPWFLESYAKKVMNREDNIDTVYDYWEFMRKFMIGISIEDVQLYFPKYEITAYNYGEMSIDIIFKDNEYKQLSYNWNFPNWLAIYTGSMQYKEIYEKYKERENKYEL